jgi:tetratricopeptide (TPR) repeat protein
MKIIFSAALVLITCSVNAQTIEQGKKYMYYERYQSAKNEFSNVLSQKPADPEATYWLGQAEIALGNIDVAKNLYRTAVKDNNHPLLVAGCGQADLLENKTAEAKNRFESAITMTKSKNPDVLAAIARAHINSPAGDGNYAVNQLKTATTIKGVKDASLFILMGDAYVKLREGGLAVNAYDDALLIDPNNALALYHQASIYLTVNAKQTFLPLFEKALEKDPAFAPAYFSLYEYWFKRDVNKAENYLKQYISNTDQDPQNAYYMINLKGASKQYAEAIKDADALIQQIGPDNVKPRIYRLKASCYKDLGDLSNALKSADEFFKRIKPTDILPQDYELYADILALTEGQQASAFTFYEKALSIDTVSESRSALMVKGYDLAKKMKDKKSTLLWMERVYTSKQSPSNVDLSNLGRAYLEAGEIQFSNYAKADSVFGMYTSKYPAQAFGYYWRGRANWSIDSTMAKGMANPHFEKFLDIATSGPDSVSLRSQIKIAYRYFVGFYALKQDYSKALSYCDRILAIDPADKDAQELKKQLSRSKFPLPSAMVEPKMRFALLQDHSRS